MTKKEQALGLFTQAADELNTLDERVMALEELLALKKSAKTSWDKLGVDQDQLEALQNSLDGQLGAEAEAVMVSVASEATTEPETDPLEEAIMPEQKAKNPKAKADTERGLITALTKKLLLEDDAPYAEIVDVVKAKFPEAKTTARSVASVASEMRKKGEKVASRRKTMNDLDKESM